MPSRLHTAARPAPRLRASPNFAQSFTLDGRAYIAKDSEPYIQYWLDERYRILLSMFSGRRGATPEEALAGYFRFTRAPRTVAERKRLLKAMADMRESEVLIRARDDTSRYTAQIVKAYVAHRPFPRALARLITREAPVRADTAVLDLAGGPGDLALALAATSRDVAMMDLSKGFVNAAKRRAKARGLALRGLHDSANRLVYRDEQYDVVTVSQALHWLDDVMVCRGLTRCLRAGGSFFVVSGAFEVDDAHPLAYLLGRRSILGDKPPQSFAAQVTALARRLTLLFEALDAPDVHRVDLAQTAPGAGEAARIVPAGAWLFRQPRPMDEGFARAFLTPQHIAVTGQAPDVFWRDVAARCANATPAQLGGTYDWAILQFRRGAAAVDYAARLAGAPTQIDYEAPVTPA